VVETLEEVEEDEDADEESIRGNGVEGTLAVMDVDVDVARCEPFAHSSHSMLVGPLEVLVETWQPRLSLPRGRIR
jgi:hypothetical protein